MKYSLIQQALGAFAIFVSSASALSLTVGDDASIRDTAATVAFGLMKNYQNNQTSTPPGEVGSFPHPPIYWWNSGAIWGGMVDYTMYTGDQSYAKTITDALAANVGEKADLILEAKRGQEGTDDQAFWALTMMSAAEANFPVPSGSPTWADVAKGAFKSITSRWDTASCGGGFFWQIYPDNFHGLDYKNSVANGGLFQLAGRLALMTKDDSYVEWAEKVYDWMTGVGLITDAFEVYDGAGTESDCKSIDLIQWTYNTGLFTYGSAVLYAHTGDQKWLDRTNGFLGSARKFFDHHSEAPNVMAEIACEGNGKCNMDMQSFKAYLARWLAKTSVLVPETAETIRPWLEASAQAAAGSCSGPDNACGSKWWVGGYDDAPGVNQQLCAMETIQSLLISKDKMFGVLEAPESQPEPAPEQQPASSEAPPPAASTEAAAAPAPPASSEAAVAPAPSTEAAAPPPSVVSPPAAPPAVEVTSAAEASASFCDAPPTTVTVTETAPETPVALPVVPATTVSPQESSICEVPVVVTVTETASQVSTTLKPLTTQIATPAPTSPGAITTSRPSPSPSAFLGAAGKNHVGSFWTGIGSFIAVALMM